MSNVLVQRCYTDPPIYSVGLCTAFPGCENYFILSAKCKVSLLRLQSLASRRKIPSEEVERQVGKYKDAKRSEDAERYCGEELSLLRYRQD
ncbi:hypothetical protein AV530_011896 [Patagioenas fasciata monilis]|uniref:Uncharacterized protein n=1 Tax=Patagioenas fasciata monilis TaxID=372326 RepID=A0A1V4JVK1_PATFA|nr:hypothetical protein AV530_011896 [Patagioenas fasciata monilis]